MLKFLVLFPLSIFLSCFVLLGSVCLAEDEAYEPKELEIFDYDGDGTPDSEDGCPEDPLKITEGVCGCFSSEIDADLDGTPDCIDDCPDDPTRSFLDESSCACLMHIVDIATNYDSSSSSSMDSDEENYYEDSSSSEYSSSSSEDYASSSSDSSEYYDDYAYYSSESSEYYDDSAYSSSDYSDDYLYEVVAHYEYSSSSEYSSLSSDYYGYSSSDSSEDSEDYDDYAYYSSGSSEYYDDSAYSSSDYSDDYVYEHSSSSFSEDDMHDDFDYSSSSEFFENSSENSCYTCMEVCAADDLKESANKLRKLNAQLEAVKKASLSARTAYKGAKSKRDDERMRAQAQMKSLQTKYGQVNWVNSLQKAVDSVNTRDDKKGELLDVFLQDYYSPKLAQAVAAETAIGTVESLIQADIDRVTFLITVRVNNRAVGLFEANPASGEKYTEKEYNTTLDSAPNCPGILKTTTKEMHGYYEAQFDAQQAFYTDLEAANQALRNLGNSASARATQNDVTTKWAAINRRLVASSTAASQMVAANYRMISLKLFESKIELAISTEELKQEKNVDDCNTATAELPIPGEGSEQCLETI
jgi:hypothetical protein